jgi:hypothetical protein
MQREIVRGRPENRWAELPAATPWEMAYRGYVTVAALALGLIALCGLGILVVTGLFNLEPVHKLLYRFFEKTWRFCVQLTQGDVPGLSWLSSLITDLGLPVLPLVLLLAATWAIVRAFELFLRTWMEDPRKHRFILRFPLHLLIIFRYALPVFLIGFVVLRMFDDGPESVRSTSLIVLVMAGLIWIGLRYWATSLKLAVEFQELRPPAEIWRRFLLDAVRFAMLVVVVIAALVIAQHLPTSFLALLGNIVVPLTFVLLRIVLYVVAGLLVCYAVSFCLLLVIRTHERRDRVRFKSAEALLTEADDHAPV